MNPKDWTLRRALVRLHRWVALALGGWFVLVGLTGAALVWHAEVDAWLNPAWFDARARCAPAAPRPIARALEVFDRHSGGARAAMVTAPQTHGAAYIVWERRADGKRRQHFVDIDCAQHLGARDWGAARLDAPHLVPALYELHRSLLAGPTGHVVVGVGGLVLLGLALTGLVAAWPRTSSMRGWARALSIKRGAAPVRRYYDLHRAVGLWLLPFLLLISVTGAYLCFPEQGRALVAGVLPTLEQGWQRLPPAADPAPQQTPDALISAAQALWPNARWSRIQLPDAKRPHYELRLLQTGEPRADTGDTRVRLSAGGQVVAVRDALHAPAGETLLMWLFPLHSAEALGLAGRIAWTVFGAVPALLLVTGAWLWWRRRPLTTSRENLRWLPIR